MSLHAPMNLEGSLQLMLVGPISSTCGGLAVYSLQTHSDIKKKKTAVITKLDQEKAIQRQLKLPL